MQEEMKLQDYVRISIINIWKNKFLIATITLLFLLLGILVSSWQVNTNIYYANATVYTVFGTIQEIEVATDALTGYADIVRSRKVCERAEAIIGDSSINANLIRSMITSSYNKSSTVMTVSAYSANSEIAIKVANAVAEAFVIEIQSMTGSDRIQMLDEAVDARMSNNGLMGMIKTVMLAGVAGFTISIIIIIAGVIFSNKIKCVEQCFEENEDEILGVIPFIE